MWQADSHLSDQHLLRKLDGELSAGEARKADAHLAACWTCRARVHELEDAVEEFARIHRRDVESVSSAAGPRALLKVRLAALASAPEPTLRWMFARNKVTAVAALATITVALMLAGAAIYRHFAPAPKMMVVFIPDSRLTPGAAILQSRRAVCEETNVKNKSVPVALQRKVFEAYGITPAESADYEVDYLITPALGGADDIHNLWPHSYKATVWNAEVKDALEDRLREMVCSGDLDLTEAQQELATNWISAYKKYFHTEQPIDDPRRP